MEKHDLMTIIMVYFQHLQSNRTKILLTDQ